MFVYLRDQLRVGHGIGLPGPVGFSYFLFFLLGLGGVRGDEGGGG